MKKIIYLLLLLSCFAGVYNSTAQTLTSVTTVPAVGDSFNVKSVDSLSLISFVPPDTGTGQTWNYSAWNTLIPYYLKCVSPSATPFDTTFNGSTYGIYNSNDTTYTFYSLQAGTLTLDGIASNLATISYANTEKVFTFPVSYSSVRQTDNYNFSFFLSTLSMTVTATGLDSIIALASGTLKLPGGLSIPSVMCVKRIAHETDIVGTFGSATRTTTSYEYYNDLNKIPLLKVVLSATTALTTTTNQRSATILLNPAVGPSLLSDLNFRSSMLQISPNPGSNSVEVSMGIDISSITVQDILGSVVCKSTRSVVDVSGLPAGLYMIWARDVLGNAAIGKFLKN